MSTLVALLWAAVLLRLAWAVRPVPRRVAALVAVGATGDAAPRSSVLVVVGRWARRPLRLAPDPVAERRTGGALLLGLVVGLVVPPLGLLAAVAWWSLPLARARRAARAHERAAQRDLPDLVDLLAVAVGAGLTVPLAFDALGPRLDGPLGDGVAEVRRQLAMGVPRPDAMHALVEVAGPSARPLVAALQRADRYGLPLLAVLERLGGEARQRRRRQAEAEARRAPVRLLFPLVLCTLPAFALLTVVPLLAGSLSTLRS